MRRIALWFHVSDIDDRAMIKHKSDRQRTKGIAHPETLNVCLVKDKQHAVIGGERFAIHQSRYARLRRGCDLRLNDVHSGAKSFDRKRRV